MSAALRRAPLASLLVVAAACVRGEALELVRHEAGAQSGARLNQPIVLTFGARLDPGSVRPESVRVVRARDGSAVAGRLAVAEAVVTFTPRIACRPDLSDGGFEPGERYRVEVPGLPQLACVRSLDGALLGAGVAFEFTTVAAAGDAKAGELFVDANPGVRPHFEPSARLVDGRTRIRFSKPLDPRTIAGASFWFEGPWHLSARPRTDPLFRATLVENDTEAVIELAVEGPLPAPIDPAEKSYAVALELSKLHDFSGAAPTPDKGKDVIALVVAAKEQKDNP
jgi:hypothetical protein